VGVAAPQIALAIGLRGQPISDEEFCRRASLLRSEIRGTMAEGAHHMGIRRIRKIFREYEERLFHWSVKKAVSANNNLAEWDLRPSVIARKES
jgi:transposase